VRLPIPPLSHKIKFLKNKQQAVIITIKKAIEKKFNEIFGFGFVLWVFAT
jgi:hypothetical protein